MYVSFSATAHFPSSLDSQRSTTDAQHKKVAGGWILRFWRYLGEVGRANLRGELSLEALMYDDTPIQSCS